MRHFSKAARLSVIETSSVVDPGPPEVSRLTMSNILKFSIARNRTASIRNGTVIGSYRGTIHFSSSDPNAILPDDYTFTAADNGQHQFAAVLFNVGPGSITVTEVERDILGARGIAPVYVIPNIHDVKPLERRRFENTADILFIGSYDHPPNVDGAIVLVEDSRMMCYLAA